MQEEAHGGRGVDIARAGGGEGRGALSVLRAPDHRCQSQISTKYMQHVYGSV